MTMLSLQALPCFSLKTSKPPHTVHRDMCSSALYENLQGVFLSCLVSLKCTLWEGFFWRVLKQAYTVPCRASHPRGQGAQVSCT